MGAGAELSADGHGSLAGSPCGDAEHDPSGGRKGCGEPDLYTGQYPDRRCEHSCRDSVHDGGRRSVSDGGGCGDPGGRDVCDGCGIRARATEKADRSLEITFPGIIGIPAEFDQIQKIILDILPCHLAVEFFFHYLTWAYCETLEYTWEKQ